MEKKYLIVTDEGCYSDYGFHIAVATEAEKVKIVSLFKLLEESKNKIKPEYEWRTPGDEWLYKVKRLRYVQEVLGEPEFNDISQPEWNWLNPEQLIGHYEKYLVQISNADSDEAAPHHRINK